MARSIWRWTSTLAMAGALLVGVLTADPPAQTSAAPADSGRLTSRVKPPPPPDPPKPGGKRSPTVEHLPA